MFTYIYILLGSLEVEVEKLEHQEEGHLHATEFQVFLMELLICTAVFGSASGSGSDTHTHPHTHTHSFHSVEVCYKMDEKDQA